MILADARHLPIADGVVQCCVTSPPYWGLRDYGTATWEGGEASCAHKGRVKPRQDTTGSGVDKGRFAETRGLQPGKSAYSVPVRETCRCGARRIDHQIGLESSPDDYVASLVSVFREVGRTLRDDGVIWVNLGDSYATGTTAPRRPTTIAGPMVPASWAGRSQAERCGTPAGIKTKDLIGIPWMVALALRDDGWYLRSDIIWSKPNPMPESVTDRPTKSHEYVFLLTKSERYFYDAAAIREPYAASTVRQAIDGYDGEATKDYAGAGVQNPSDVKRRIIDSVRKSGNKQRKDRSDHGGVDGDSRHQAFGIPWQGDGTGRNCRSVWSITTQPFAGAHFATMPEKLVERCVLAGSRPGDLVLDPFLGSGTVARVALSLGRRAIGCDLQRAYLPLQRERMRVTRGLPLELDRPASLSLEIP